MVTDPVCHTDVDPEETDFRTEYFGETYYFCSTTCKLKFDMDPLDYIEDPWRVTAAEREP